MFYSYYHWSTSMPVWELIAKTSPRSLKQVCTVGSPKKERMQEASWLAIEAPWESRGGSKEYQKVPPNPSWCSHQGLRWLGCGWPGSCQSQKKLEVGWSARVRLHRRGARCPWVPETQKEVGRVTDRCKPSGWWNEWNGTRTEKICEVSSDRVLASIYCNGRLGLSM